MNCKENHQEINHILQQLPITQGGIGRHKCAGCAFEEGYKDGLAGNHRDISLIIASLPYSQAGVQRHRCPLTAYSIGYDIGSKIACRKVEIVNFKLSSVLPVPKRTKKIQEWKLLAIFPVNNEFVVGVYNGTISPYDMIVKYWKYNSTLQKWERPLQPKHIHWVVDVLIKQAFSNNNDVHKFIEKLIEYWNSKGGILPLRTEQDQIDFLNVETLYRYTYIEEMRYPHMSVRGEYPLSFLILLARILMVQERTNYQQAFMFENLLKYMQKEDFYRTINTATHNGR